MNYKLPSQAWFISFGQPILFNILDYDQETDQYQIQVPGYYGSQWRKKDSAMSLNDVELWVFEEAAKESSRLNSLKIEQHHHSR